MRIEDYLDQVTPRPEQPAVQHLRNKGPGQVGSWCGEPLVEITEGLAVTCADCWVDEDGWQRRQVLDRMRSQR